MARILAAPLEARHLLDTGWRMAVTPAGAWGSPDVPRGAARFVDAPVPGTAAQALEQAGLWSRDDPQGFDDCDVWYETTIEGNGTRTLRFHGLATHADVWLDDAPILQSRSMFIAHDVAVTLRGSHRLSICFRALRQAFEAPAKRARWRPRVVTPPGLRLVRTSLIGRMPGWQPPIHPVGPWRAIEMFETASPMSADVHATLEGDDGVVTLTLADGGRLHNPRLVCDATRAAMRRIDKDTLSVRLVVPDPPRWMPHTHGTPHRHGLRVDSDEGSVDLGRVGFRSIAVDHDSDGQGFGLVVNGLPVFCRGAVWTSADIVALPGARSAYAPLLTAMRDAGMNMVRIGGTMTYETNAFFELCDELGLLVWQDFMFSNFDYPKDDAFLALAAQEAAQLLDRTQTSPSLAVVCGGSEIAQQATMFGLPVDAARHPLFDTILPAEVARYRKDVAWLANTPSGGALPFMPNTGVSHYYGVSAYKRPLEDVRRAKVRFASECLGHANVPALDVALAADGVAQRCWAERIAHDAGATWFFEDVRTHYIEQLYGVAALPLLHDDPLRYLTLSRATNAELMEAVIAEFRRPGSPTRGALVWFLKDVVAGAGWGVLDERGLPKSVYYALARAFRPVQALLSDEGLNGLDVHLLNETGAPIAGTMTLVCLAEGTRPVMQASRTVELPARGSLTFAAFDLFGGFFDIAYAYRFGPPAHDVTALRLADKDDATLAEAFHFPQGRGAARHDLGLDARVEHDGADAVVQVTTRRFAQNVHFIAPSGTVSDNWFHLAPGVTKHVRLTGVHGAAAHGRLSALNGLDDIAFGEVA